MLECLLGYLFTVHSAFFLDRTACSIQHCILNIHLPLPRDSLSADHNPDVSISVVTSRSSRFGLAVDWLGFVHGYLHDCRRWIYQS